MFRLEPFRALLTLKRFFSRVLHNHMMIQQSLAKRLKWTLCTEELLLTRPVEPLHMYIQRRLSLELRPAFGAHDILLVRFMYIFHVSLQMLVHSKHFAAIMTGACRRKMHDTVLI